jgi:hypothetical protein
MAIGELSNIYGSKKYNLYNRKTAKYWRDLFNSCKNIDIQHDDYDVKIENKYFD